MSTSVSSAFLLRITLVATLGGFLMGYDTAVINGAIDLITSYFDLTPTQKGLATSSALIGCLVGSIMAGRLTGAIGRKLSLILAAACFTLSALGTALPETYEVFLVFRILGGIGVGIASMVSPMYIAEIAPAAQRGRLVTYYQFAVVIGILIVFLANYWIADPTDHVWNDTVGWRWMFGSETIPAGLFFILLFTVPETPRHLILKGKEKKAEGVLTKLLGAARAVEVIDEVKGSLKIQSKLPKVKLGKYWKLIVLGGLLSLFQQVSGINVILYYGKEIFSGVFQGREDVALLQNVIVGAVNFAFTIVAIWLIDKVGRKPLMQWGAAGMAVTIIGFGLGIYLSWDPALQMILVLGFIAAFAASFGPVVWVMLSEIFPNRVRGAAMAIAVAVQWLANALVSQTFPMMQDPEGALFQSTKGAFPFWFYGTCCLIAWAYVTLRVPETKGQTLEEIEASLSNR